MKRSLYPDGVEVTQDDLERTETTKADAIKDRASEATRVVRAGADFRPGGVVSGLRVTPHSTNAAVDITPGIAYAPNGERIIVDVSQLDQAISDPTADKFNYVCLVYTEITTTNRPHESDGTTPETEATAFFRVAVKTQVELDALPATNADLSIDAADRTVVVARVNGAGASTPPTNVAQAALLTADRVHAEYGTNADGPLPGVNIVGHGAIVPITPNLAETAQIQLVVSGGGTSKILKYKQEGSATFGSGTPPGNVASFTGEADLIAGTGSVLRVDIDATLLPDTDGTYTRELTVQPLYDVNGPLHSPADIVHRHLQGDGASTTGNPHGTGINDLAQSFLKFFGTLGLGDDLLATLDAATTPRLQMDTADAALGANTKTMLAEFRTDSAGSPGHVRVYLDAALQGLEITSNAAWNTTTGDYDPDSTDIGAVSYQLIIGQRSAFTTDYKFRLAERRGVGGTFSTFNGVIESFTGLGDLLALGSGALTTDSEGDAARLRIDGASNASPPDRVHVFASSSSLVAADEPLHAYRVNVGGSDTAPGAGFELVANATWSNETSLWSRVNATDAIKLEYTNNSIIAWRSPGTATWVDGAWVRVSRIWFSTGAVRFEGTGGLYVEDEIESNTSMKMSNGDFIAQGATSNYTYNPARTFTKRILGISGIPCAAQGTFRGSDFALKAGDGFNAVPKISSDGDDGYTGDLISIIWPVDLPVGASIIEVRIHGFFDATSGSTIKAAMVSSALTSGTTSVGTEITAGAASPLITVPVSLTVDSLRTYYVRLEEDGTGATCDTTVYNLEVDYTLADFRPD